VSASARNPATAIGIWCGVLLLAAYGGTSLRIDTSTSSFLDRYSPEWSVYQHSVEAFGGDEFLAVVLRGAEPYSPGVMKLIKELTEEFGQLHGVRRVDSIATVPLIRSASDGAIALDSGIAARVPDSTLELARLREELEEDRVAARSLVSADGRSFAINLVLDGRSDSDIASLLQHVRSRVAGHQALISGVPVFRTEVNLRTEREVALLVPATVVVISAVVWWALRSLIGVALASVMGGAGVAIAVGGMGFLGVTLSLSTMILPSTLLALGCAYSMHPLAAIVAGRGIEGVKATAPGVGLSGLTTAVGFVSMGAAGVDAIRDLAVFGALGVVGITLAVLTLLPAMLVLIGCTRLESNALEWLSKRVVGFVAGGGVRFRRGTFLAWAVCAATAAAGVGLLRIETDIIRWFPRGSEIREDYEIIRALFSGISPVNVMIRSEGDRSVDEPNAVETIDRLGAALEESPVVGKALSIADPLKEMNRVLDARGTETLPESESLIQQYLLLLEGIPQIGDVITNDRREGNLILRVDDNSSHEIVELGEWVRQWWSTEGVPGYSVNVTGIMYEFARSEEAIARGQLIGLALATLMVFGILWSALGTWGIGIVASLPNVFPILIVYGLMGFSGVPLDAATACLGSLALGIAVDDTVHIILGVIARTTDRCSQASALMETVAEAGPALVITTVAISLGFGVLAISDFTLVRNLGLVTSLLVGLCLVADLTLLPALLTSSRLKRIWQ